VVSFGVPSVLDCWGVGVAVLPVHRVGVGGSGWCLVVWIFAYFFLWFFVVLLGWFLFFYAVGFNFRR